ncbi:MAG: acyl-CoA dehydrogenase family protein [Nitrososphaerales archaeon]
MYRVSQEQEILRETVREFSRSEISPLAATMDWEGRVPDSLLAKLPSLGLYGITIPAEFGGVGADFLSALIVSEELARASGSIGAQFSIHNAVVCEAFRISSNSKLKESMFPKLASGTLGAFTFDPKSSLTCKIEGSDIVVNGTSEYVINAERAGIFVLKVRLSGSKNHYALIAFEKDQVKDSFSVGEAKKLMGMRAAGTATISLNNLRLPLASLLCDVQKTAESLSKLTYRARFAIASQALGLAQASLDSEIIYANERRQFNTPIARFYAVQDFIATDAISLETSRSLTYLSASQIDTLQSIGRESAIAKISSSNCAVTAARHAIRIHGGYGFVRDYPVERYLRDARLTQIYMEANESLKAAVASSLLGL